MGLIMDSVLMADNIAAVRHAEIERVLGACPAMTLVDNALRFTLAL